MTLDALFAQPAALPTVPKVVQQLIASFSRDDVAITDVAEPLSADPVLAAKTLRLANSAYFHVSRRIATVDDALRMLGFVMVRNLVVGSGMAQAFKSVKGLDLPAFWRRQLHTAAAARWLAAPAGQNADLAFTGGLIHGLGHLVLHAVQPAEMAALNTQCGVFSPGRAAAERAALGLDHAQVGAELARRWKFPDELAEPIAHVPDPLAATPAQPMAALLHLAAWAAAEAAAAELPAGESATECADPPYALAAVASAAGLDARWDAGTRTLYLRQDGKEQAMPAVDQLTQGLDGMFG